MKRWLSRIDWRDVFTFLLFFALALIVWYGHAMQSVRNTHVPVLIQYTGKPDNIGLQSPGLPDTVMVEVRDAGQRLVTYLREPLRLTIDLRSYIHGEKGTIHIPSDALRRSISDILQGTSRLIETTPEEITCPYFTEQEKTVPVAWCGNLSTADEYQLVGEPLLNYPRVKLYGQDKHLNTIDTIRTEFVTLEELSDTTRTRVALSLPPGIRCETDSVDVSIIAERFTEKKFIIPLHVTGVPEGAHIRLFPREIEVNLRVGMSHFCQVQSTDVRAICVYSPERKDKLDVELRYTNPYITSAWAYPAVVEFLIEQ
ncbi:MAG: hypothetical protein J5902_06730 [Paludibacteraceae bacterium]|nr:hypothetical protein [Paludibacteraceae bacterium]